MFRAIKVVDKIQASSTYVFSEKDNHVNKKTVILSTHLVELIVVVHAYILRVDMCTYISHMCSAYEKYLIIINIIKTMLES